MKRRLFTIAIFAALLVGCAASAMRFGAPQTVDASLNQSHVKPTVVTGPCYKSNGNNCATSFHFVHDVQLEQVAGACTNGSSCTLEPALSFTGSAGFANTNFDCHGLLIYPVTTTSFTWFGVILNFVAGGTTGSGDTANVGFRNETGSTITDAYVKIAYTCEGA